MSTYKILRLSNVLKLVISYYIYGSIWFKAVWKKQTKHTHLLPQTNKTHTIRKIRKFLFLGYLEETKDKKIRIRLTLRLYIILGYFTSNFSCLDSFDIMFRFALYLSDSLLTLSHQIFNYS